MLLTITGLGLGAMYFLIASGLSLIYGLMGVLNFAHGALLTVGAYSTWWMSTKIDAARHEAPRRRDLRDRRRRCARCADRARSDPSALPASVEQVLVTVGLALALNALVEAIWSFDARPFPVPSWLIDTTSVFGASIPNDRFVEIEQPRSCSSA